MGRGNDCDSNGDKDIDTNQDCEPIGDMEINDDGSINVVDLSLNFSRLQLVR